MDTSGDHWLAVAQSAYESARRIGDDALALTHTAHTLERINRELGAPLLMEFWLDALDALLAPWSMAPPAELEPLVFNAALAVLARRPAHPALPLWHGRALARIRSRATDPDSALRAAHFSFEYAVRSGNFPLAREVVDHARPHAAHASASVRSGWFEAEALLAWLSADHARAHALVVQALAAGSLYGAWEQGASAAISEGDLARADVCLAEMAARVDRNRPQDVAHSSFLGAARARLGGDVALASERIDACMTVEGSAIALYFITLWQLGRAHIAIARGQHRRAAGELTVVLARAASYYWRFLHFSALVARTWLRIREQRQQAAADDLQSALTLARLHGYRNTDPWWDPEAIGDIATFARDIEHDQRTLAAFVSRSVEE